MLRSAIRLSVLLCILATPLEAQGLRQKINELFTFGDCGEPLCLPLDPARHGSHYIPAREASNAAVLTFIQDAIARSIGNIPISAASGGATFTFEGGLPVRTTVSAGPIFGERAQTLGRGRLLAGANVSAVQFTSLRGTPLDDIVLNFTHQNVGPPDSPMGAPTFENDIFQVRAALDLDLLVTTFFATYGVLDGVDIGVAIPLVRASLRGRSEAQIFPFSYPSLDHHFGTPEAPSLQETSSVEGSATGIGDAAVRVKMTLGQSPRFGYGLLGDVRLPTGDAENLLGSGELAVRGIGVFSARLGDFSPHANLGYLFRAGERQSSAVLATVGFDHLLAPWATLAFDLISELPTGEALELPTPVIIEQPFTRRVLPTNIPDRRDDLLNASLGAKFSAMQGFNVVINSVVPLNSGGLRPNAIWTAGLEYNF